MWGWAQVAYVELGGGGGSLAGLLRGWPPLTCQHRGRVVELKQLSEREASRASLPCYNYLTDGLCYHPASV